MRSFEWWCGRGTDRLRRVPEHARIYRALGLGEKRWSSGLTTSRLGLTSSTHICIHLPTVRPLQALPARPAPHQCALAGLRKSGSMQFQMLWTTKMYDRHTDIMLFWWFLVQVFKRQWMSLPRSLKDYFLLLSRHWRIAKQYNSLFDVECSTFFVCHPMPTPPWLLKHPVPHCTKVRHRWTTATLAAKPDSSRIHPV